MEVRARIAEWPRGVVSAVLSRGDDFIKICLTDPSALQPTKLEPVSNGDDDDELEGRWMDKYASY